jgi:hypothetical protein
MAADRPAVFEGRAAQRALLDGLLENVRGGQSSALVIRGEAGIGKTALLEYCAEQASGFQVARAAGVETEMELPFAGLHQLCAPMLARLDALAEPQQAALRVAFGLDSGDAPERFLVALAPLSLLAEVARSGRCSVSSRMRSGSTAPRPRCSGSSPDGCWPRQWRSCSPCASRPTNAGCEASGSSSSRVSTPRTPARCSRPSSPAVSTSASAIGSSPRHAAIRLHCWNCREG